MEDLLSYYRELARKPARPLLELGRERRRVGLNALTPLDLGAAPLAPT